MGEHGATPVALYVPAAQLTTGLAAHAAAFVMSLRTLLFASVLWLPDHPGANEKFTTCPVPYVLTATALVPRVCVRINTVAGCVG
jgi:hypothetical protein